MLCEIAKATQSIRTRTLNQLKATLKTQPLRQTRRWKKLLLFQQYISVHCCAKSALYWGYEREWLGLEIPCPAAPAESVSPNPITSSRNTPASCLNFDCTKQQSNSRPTINQKTAALPNIARHPHRVYSSQLARLCSLRAHFYCQFQSAEFYPKFATLVAFFLVHLVNLLTNPKIYIFDRGGYKIWHQVFLVLITSVI